MFNKNISPQVLSLIAALFIAIPFSITIYAVEKKPLLSLVAFSAGIIIAYLVVNTLFQSFINRRINLIYKFIQHTKASKKEEMYYKFILPRKTLNNVQEEVEAWADQYSRELDILQKNESFRKEFLQNLSHEFKTPVFAIQGYIDTLLQGAMDNPDVNKKFLEKAARNAERLVNLINDLDEISKLERGEINLHMQYFIVQDIVREVFESLTWKSEQRHISFSIQKESDTAVTVYADKEKIRQVISNLVDNSIKYGKYGGHVIASIYKPDAENILIEITDDGMGIPEKNMNRVFERFYRTNEGRSRDITGTGLGLSICKHIIEAHGHSIHVRSKEGVGTTIGFTLDARKEGKKTTQAN